MKINSIKGSFNSNYEDFNYKLYLTINKSHAYAEQQFFSLSVRTFPKRDSFSF